MAAGGRSGGSGDSGGSLSDWISAVCSIIAAIIAFVTLLAVYVTARQLLTERREYHMGLSHDSLGPWRPKVKSKSLLGLQDNIATPFVSVPTLIKQNWQFARSFPHGFPGLQNPLQPDSERAIARTSWVNFLQALGLGSDDTSLFQMKSQSSLVNGIIPMRWAGNDLVAICSILGFSSFEDDPMWFSPMPLPMQWMGPLGWLQFRESIDGCVVEFRRKVERNNQLSQELHDCHFIAWQHEEQNIITRVWWSVNALALPNGQALYQESNRGRPPTDSSPRDDPGDGPRKGPRDDPRDDSRGNHRDSLPDAEKKVREEEREASEEIDRSAANSPAPRSERSGRSGRSERSESPRPERPKVWVVVPTQGVFASTIRADFAESRGLDPRGCIEFGRHRLKLANVDQAKYPFHFDNVYLDEAALCMFKDALELLRPDGFFFTPVDKLYDFVSKFFRHIGNVCRRRDKKIIFPTLGDDQWAYRPGARMFPNRTRLGYLRNALTMCNELLALEDFRVSLTTGDMGLICRASQSLRIPYEAPWDLSWAILYNPELFEDLSLFFEQATDLDFLTKTVNCRNGKLDCSDLLGPAGEALVEGLEPYPGGPIYDAPLCQDCKYSAEQLLVAFTSLLLTHFWVRQRRITNVELYEYAIPQTVIMC